MTFGPPGRLLKPHPLCRVEDEKYLSLRAEVEAPFRTFRIFLLFCFAISAGLATLVGTSQLVGSVAHAPAARPLEETLQTLGIDIGELLSNIIC
jgi:hypothetical protein